MGGEILIMYEYFQPKPDDQVIDETNYKFNRNVCCSFDH